MAIKQVLKKEEEMKPHTRIIYYTLLCLALNHRRSKACIYCCMEAEEALDVSALLFASSTHLRVCKCARGSDSLAVKRLHPDGALRGLISSLNPRY